MNADELREECSGLSWEAMFDKLLSARRAVEDYRMGADAEASAADEARSETSDLKHRTCRHCGGLPFVDSFPSGQEPPIVRGALDAQAAAEEKLFAERQRADSAEVDVRRAGLLLDDAKRQILELRREGGEGELARLQAALRACFDVTCMQSSGYAREVCKIVDDALCRGPAESPRAACDAQNAPACPKCGTANFTIRKRCRECGEDLVMHPDPDIDHEVRWDAEDGRRSEQAAEAVRILRATVRPEPNPHGSGWGFGDTYTREAAVRRAIALLEAVQSDPDSDLRELERFRDRCVAVDLALHEAGVELDDLENPDYLAEGVRALAARCGGPRRSFAWAQARYPGHPDWWLVEMENGEPRRAFHPPHSDSSDDGGQVLVPAWRDSFVRWCIQSVPHGFGASVPASDVARQLRNVVGSLRDMGVHGVPGNPCPWHSQIVKVCSMIDAIVVEIERAEGRKP
jgi:hypothetical protein